MTYNKGIQTNKRLLSQRNKTMNHIIVVTPNDPSQKIEICRALTVGDISINTQPLLQAYQDELEDILGLFTHMKSMKTNAVKRALISALNHPSPVELVSSPSRCTSAELVGTEDQIVNLLNQKYWALFFKVINPMDTVGVILAQYFKKYTNPKNSHTPSFNQDEIQAVVETLTEFFEANALAEFYDVQGDLDITVKTSKNYVELYVKHGASNVVKWKGERVLSNLLLEKWVKQLTAQLSPTDYLHKLANSNNTDWESDDGLLYRSTNRASWLKLTGRAFDLYRSQIKQCA